MRGRLAGFVAGRPLLLLHAAKLWLATLPADLDSRGIFHQCRGAFGGKSRENARCLKRIDRFLLERPV